MNNLKINKLKPLNSFNIFKKDLLSTNLEEFKKITILKDHKIFLEVEIFYKKLWTSFENYFPYIENGKLTEKMFLKIFNQNKNNIVLFLGKINEKELFLLLDENFKGYLLEDDILLLFNIILVKNYKLSDNLISINEFSKSKEISLQGEKINLLLSKYQNILRDKINKNDLKEFKEIGNIKIENINKKFYKCQLHNEKNKKKVYNYLEDDYYNKKLKINKYNIKERLNLNYKYKKNYLIERKNEKLVALDGRIKEANNFKKTIKEIKKLKDKNYKSEIKRKLKSKFKHLNLNHKKRKNYLETSNQQERNTINLNFQKSFDLEIKKNWIKERKILNIQKINKNNANNKLKINSKVQNIKNKTKKQEKIIYKFNKNLYDNEMDKSINFSRESNSNNSNNSIINKNFKIESSLFKLSRKNFNSINNESFKNKDLKKLYKLKNSKFIINFYIRRKYEEVLAINSKNNILKNKSYDINKYLKKEKSKIKFKLCKLYNENLEEIK